jgi:hypothetical protein
MYRVSSHVLMIGSSRGRGGLLIASGSGGLKPNAVAGGPSVTRFTLFTVTQKAVTEPTVIGYIVKRNA